MLQEVKRGEVCIDRAKEKIAETLMRIEQVKELLGQWAQKNARLPLKERCTEALAPAEEVTADPAMDRKRAELEAAMIVVENLIQETFLRG